MNKQVYKYLLGTYAKNYGIWVGYAAALIQALLIRVYVVIVMANVASNLVVGNYDGAKRNIIIYFLSYLAAVVIGTSGELVALKTENNQYAKLMVAYHSKLINKDMSFYRDNLTGYLSTVFRQYLDSTIQLTRFWRGEALGSFISLTVPAIVLLKKDTSIGLVACAVIMLQLFYILWASGKATAYRLRSQEIYRKITAEVADQITNIAAFKSSGVETPSTEKMKHLAHEEVTTFWLRRKTTALLDMPRGIITALGTAAAVYMVVGSSQQTGTQSIGLIILVLTYMFQINRNLMALPELISTHDDYITKLQPTLAYLSNMNETIIDSISPKIVKISPAEISFNKVSFSYSPSSNKSKSLCIFKDFELHIEPGEQVGIVGLSGAGKSTLANLLLRFDEVSGGSITINGVDIRELKQDFLRRNIAYVPQEPLLFHKSIRENIAYFNNKESLKNIVKAAKASHAHEFISALPNKYETIVGERGIKLSGGQKQRVAIARAILKKAPIMLFDEATSALDSESEQIIQNALPDILGKQTAIVIAHRLSTVMGLDRIIVLENGNIIESGTHEQLLANKQRYHGLWLKQTDR